MIERLRSGLSGRYEILEEVGRGGTAVVFKALDLRLPRTVAIKVLDPELTGGLGPERFLQEVNLSSKLNHPHLLPVFDSGQSEGLFYYVMPYVDGVSLRQRLDQEGPLSLEDTLEITSQVAGALKYAHDQGVLHRDIKPENILLSGDQALLADLGIARAVEKSGDSSLTRTGYSVGTPLYMSPEQAAGEQRVDGRTDQYSLACVVFEMLAGESPYSGPTPRAIIAKHVLSPIPDLRLTRSGIPQGVSAALKKALEKSPADRFAQIPDFIEALKKASLQAVHPEPEKKTARLRFIPHGLVLAALLVSVGYGVVRWVLPAGGFPGVPDPDLIAVLPFALAVGVDTTAFSDGLVADLLARRFNGDGGPRALDPGTLRPRLEEVRGNLADPFSSRSIRRIFGELSVGKALSGRVYKEGNVLFLDATVLSVPAGERLAELEDFTLEVENLEGALNEIVSRLLVQMSVEPEREAELSGRPLQAVRTYLEGTKSYHIGLYSRAVDFLRAAEDSDSTFGLAGLALSRAERMAEAYPSRGLALASRNREDLSGSDQAHLSALRGEHYPDPTGWLNRLYTWEGITRGNPDDWLAAYELGEGLFLWGRFTPLESPHPRAIESLSRSLVFHPGFVPALEPMMELAAILHDSALVREVGGRILAAEPEGDHSPFVTWRMANSLGDTAASSEVRAGFSDLPGALLERIMGSAQLSGQGLADAVEAGKAHQAKAQSLSELWWTAILNRSLLLNMGRPEEAIRQISAEPYTVPINNLHYVIEALFWGGDGNVAGAEAAESRTNVQGVRHPDRTDLAFAMHHCAATMWELSMGDTRGVGPALEALSVIEPRNSLGFLALLCGEVLGVKSAALSKSPDLRARTERLDSIMNTGPDVNSHMAFAANMTVAGAFEELGSPQAALSAVRRRSFDHTYGVVGLSAQLREEGRLASRVGDEAAAKRAYELYLALRQNPEDSQLSQADSVRAEMAALGGSVGSG